MYKQLNVTASTLSEWPIRANSPLATHSGVTNRFPPPDGTAYSQDCLAASQQARCPYPKCQPFPRMPLHALGPSVLDLLWCPKHTGGAHRAPQTLYWWGGGLLRLTNAVPIPTNRSHNLGPQATMVAGSQAPTPLRELTALLQLCSMQLNISVINIATFIIPRLCANMSTASSSWRRFISRHSITQVTFKINSR